MQDYYGSTGPVMPFHYLNPGAYVNNVTFWLKALADYQAGKARSACLCIGFCTRQDVASMGKCTVHVPCELREVLRSTHAQAPFLVVHGEEQVSNSSSGSISVPTNANGISTVTPPESSTVRGALQHSTSCLMRAMIAGRCSFGGSPDLLL